MRRATFVLATALLLQNAKDDLETLRRVYETADTPEARVSALQKIAESESPGQPSAVVAAAVAMGLHDDSYAVRKRAVELLGAGMHAETAVVSLSQAASVQARKERELWERIKKIEKESQNPWPGRYTLKELRKSLESGLEDAAYLKGVAGINETHAALVAALSGLPDDRSVAALGELLVHAINGQDPVVDALLVLGSLDALRRVVRCMTSCAKELRDAERELKELERQKSAKRPNFDDGNEWQRQENARTDKIEAQAKKTARLRLKGMTLRDKLAAFAAARGLPEVPKEAFHASKWPLWIKEAEATLPASLGRIGSSANQ